MRTLDEIEAAIPALRRLARGLMRDREAADDLVQDCLERALVKRHLWRREGPVLHWLYRIMVNRHRDGQRRARLELVPLEGLAAPPSRPGGQEARLDLREVQEALARLAPDQRKALLLVAVEGLSFDQAAKVLDIPRGTLMSRLARARAELRAQTGRESPNAKRSGRQG
jgi:RNA polymerase sigma-70 factor (ECF subfamily)